MGLILFALFAVIVVYALMWVTEHKDELSTFFAHDSALPNKTADKWGLWLCWPLV